MPRPARISYKTLAILWALTILVLTLLPSDKMPKTPAWNVISFDKAAHAFVFAVLLFLVSASFLKQQRFPLLRQRPVVAALVLCLVFGAVIEVMQGLFIPGRQGNLLDMVGNGTGCLFGITFFYLARWLRVLHLS